MAQTPVRCLQAGPREFRWGERTYLMGVVNVTPDSFSGDGLTDPDAAVVHGIALAEAGADVLDVGGESTRPGFAGVPAEEEISRVVPVVQRLARETGAVISIDTCKAAVAEAALGAGAHLVNDIWGFRLQPDLAQVTAHYGVPAVIMHNQRGRDFSGDVMADIIAGLGASLEIAGKAGIQRERLVVDPGFGFGWSEEHNLEMLRRLPELQVLGLPVLVGTSRKSTIGAVIGKPVEQRLLGTAATVALAIAGGADIVRVHDVAAMVDVVRTADAIVRGWRNPA